MTYTNEWRHYERSFAWKLIINEVVDIHHLKLHHLTLHHLTPPPPPPYTPPHSTTPHHHRKNPPPPHTATTTTHRHHHHTNPGRSACILLLTMPLNYLFHWRLEDSLESVAETFFSCPPSYMYSVKATGGRFRSFETDHKIACQGFLEKKLVEQFNKQS